MANAWPTNECVGCLCKGLQTGCAAQAPGIALFDDYDIIEQPANLSTLTLRFTHEAVGFIMDHAVAPGAIAAARTAAQVREIFMNYGNNKKISRVSECRT